MKRIGGLYERVWDMRSLEAAANRSQLGKRYRREVLRFNFDREGELRQLSQELRSASWKPGPHRHFKIFEPKERWISAAPYRDRVVHHALCRVIDPVLDRRLIHDCWANRVGKGAHRAVLRFQQLSCRHRFVLKVDLQKYFPSIDHRILKAQLRRTFKDEELLSLMDRIIDSGVVPQPHHAYVPGDDLFSPFERRKGLPIGNLTSQLWANSYLSSFDHWVKQSLCAPYLRFVDDFLLLADSKNRLVEWKERAQDRLFGLRLHLHPRKSVIRPVREGTPFLGYVVWPHKIRVRGQSVRRYRRRLGNRSSKADVARSLAAWRGHVGLAGSFRQKTMW